MTASAAELLRRLQEAPVVNAPTLRALASQSSSAKPTTGDRT
jgi:hypothetical protein